MLYFSHLLEDEDTKAVINATGMGVESIEFAISENLNQLKEKIFSYQKRLKDMDCKKLVLHGPFLDLNPMTFDDRIQAVTRQRYEEAYAAAKSLGAKKLCIILVMCRIFICLLAGQNVWQNFLKNFWQIKMIS